MPVPLSSIGTLNAVTTMRLCEVAVPENRCLFAIRPATWRQAYAMASSMGDLKGITQMR